MHWCLDETMALFSALPMLAWGVEWVVARAQNFRGTFRRGFPYGLSGAKNRPAPFKRGVSAH